MADVKAGTVIFIRNRLRTLGGDAERSFLAKLPPEAVASYKGALPVSWIPIAQAAILYTAAAATLYPGDREGLRKLGMEVARANFSSLYRVLLRVLTVPYMLEQAAKLWRTLHTDGTIETEVLGPKRILVQVSNHPEFVEPVREAAAGQFAGLIELTGARDVRVARDDLPTVWRWYITWS